MIQQSRSTRSNCLTISFQRWASSSFDNAAVATAAITREGRAMLSNHRVFLALPPPHARSTKPEFFRLLNDLGEQSANESNPALLKKASRLQGRKRLARSVTVYLEHAVASLTEQKTEIERCLKKTRRPGSGSRDSKSNGSSYLKPQVQ